MFKSDDGANAFSQLHSILETAKENNQDPFMVLITVAENVIGKNRGK